MRFSSAETKKLEKLANFYVQVKAIVLYAEEIDPDSRSNLQILKELRDAFDHLMILFAKKIRARDAKSGKLALVNIEKAFDHVYRAGFDALDGTVISLKENIAHMLARFPQETVLPVLPDYWDLKKEILRLEEQVAKHRAERDTAPEIGRVFDGYVKDVNNLAKIHTRIVESGPMLDECFKGQRKAERKRDIKTITVSAIVGLVVGLVAGILLTVMTPWFRLNNAARVEPTQESRSPAVSQDSLARAATASRDTNKVQESRAR